jgi:hypothetical protein
MPCILYRQAPPSPQRSSPPMPIHQRRIRKEEGGPRINSSGGASGALRRIERYPEERVSARRTPRMPNNVKSSKYSKIQEKDEDFLDLWDSACYKGSSRPLKVRVVGWEPCSPGTFPRIWAQGKEAHSPNTSRNPIFAGG